MTTIVTRAGKGAPLTADEHDANLNNLNSAKVETAQVIATTAPLTGGGAVGAGLSLGIDAATESAIGAVRLATAAQTTEGASNLLAVHPAGLKGELDKKANLIASGAVVDTIAALRATAAPTAASSTLVLVKHYSTAGDGGGGEFYWDSASTATDNGGTIIKPTAVAVGDPGRWMRVYSGSSDVRWFGARGDGVADDSAAIQAAIGVAATNKVRDVLLGASHILSTSIDVPYSNINLVGRGADRSHDVGLQGAQAGTTLTWTGSSGTNAVITFRSPEGASNQKMVGGGIKNVYINVGGNANYAIEIKSVNSAIFENIHATEPAVAMFHFTVVTTLGEARDPQENKLRNCSVRAFTNAAGLVVLDGDNAASPVANTSFNLFEQCRASIRNGTAFLLNNCDHNTFIQCYVNRASGGTGNAIVFNGSNADVAGIARHNLFIALSIGGSAGIIGRGTTSFTHPSYNNNVLLVDKGNATPDPTIEAGASIWYSTDEHIAYKSGHNQAVIGTTTVTIDAARDAITTESLRITNTSSNHVRIVDSSGNEWGLSIDSANGNLRLVRISGTGVILTSNSVQVGNIGFYNTAPVARQNVTGSRGGNAALDSLLQALAASGLITNSTTA